MKKGDYAKLTFEKTLCKGDLSEGRDHTCTVLQYDRKQEYILLRLEGGSSLESVSLDAIYLCEIHAQEEGVSCTGRVKERYCGKEGRVLAFQIENGFYKINIKSLTNI